MITTAAAACDDLLIPVNAPDVRQRFAQARQSGLRAKEAAESMGLPEGAAIGAHAGLHDGGLQVVPLRAQWLQVLRALQNPRCMRRRACTRSSRPAVAWDWRWAARSTCACSLPNGMPAMP
jgi:hypothetical protein